MKISRTVEFIQLALIGAMLAAALLSWNHVPSRLPIHWNLQGHPDSYGGRFAGLLLVPLATLVLYGLLLVLPRFDPGYRNYASFAATYNVIRVALVGFMCVVFTVTLLVAWGYRVDVTAAVAVALGVLFLILGGSMGKLRPNWFAGVRTPWTLSSELSWYKTHRLAGWLFGVMGLMIMALGFVRTPGMLVLTVSTCVASGVLLFAYSYWVYRHDPARQTPPGAASRVE